jgi:hypothetical protein
MFASDVEYSGNSIQMTNIRQSSICIILEPTGNHNDAALFVMCCIAGADFDLPHSHEMPSEKPVLQSILTSP